MNGAAAALREARALSEALAATPVCGRVALFPPAVLIHRMAEALRGGPVAVGGQDCHVAASGAHTGDVSAEMLRDAGATLVILGHSERRTDHRESNALIAAKVKAALRAKLEPVICVGETLAERRAGCAPTVIEAQLAASLPDALRGHAFAVAYEPVWAIGSGLTPTLEEVAQMHGLIHRLVTARFGGDVPVLYGGSVKPANAVELLGVRGVDGALVGGASLNTRDFLPIVKASGAAVRAPQS